MPYDALPASRMRFSAGAAWIPLRQTQFLTSRAAATTTSCADGCYNVAAFSYRRVGRRTMLNSITTTKQGIPSLPVARFC